MEIANEMIAAVAADAAAGTNRGEGYITKRMVAQRTHKTVRTIEEWMRRGLIPYYKIGHSTLFRWSEIEDHFRQTCRVSALQ